MLTSPTLSVGASSVGSVLLCLAFQFCNWECPTKNLIVFLEALSKTQETAMSAIDANQNCVAGTPEASYEAQCLCVFAFHSIHSFRTCTIAFPSYCAPKDLCSHPVLIHSNTDPTFPLDILLALSNFNHPWLMPCSLCSFDFVYPGGQSGQLRRLPKSSRMCQWCG